MIIKLTILGLILEVFNVTWIRAENTELVMRKLKRADSDEMTTDLSDDEYADKIEVRLNDITNEPLQNSSTTVSNIIVEDSSGEIRSENTTIFNAVNSNSLAETENYTGVDGMIDDIRTGEKIVPKLQLTDELTNMTDVLFVEKEESLMTTTELSNVTSESNPIKKVIEVGEPQLFLGAISLSGKAKSKGTANEDFVKKISNEDNCEEVIDYGPKEGLDINASLESNRTANSSEPFIVERKFKVDEANKDFNADEILKRYEEIVNNDTESQFKFCKNGQCNDCNNMTIMNSTEREICFTFHNFKEDFEDIRSMERMLQNTTKTSLDNDSEVIEKVCYKIQDEQFELVKQEVATTECGAKDKTMKKKKKKKRIKGRKFWPHHKKNP